MTWEELAAAARARVPVLVPVGATEQHGPHLAVDVDTQLAAAVPLRLPEDRSLVVAPALSYGARSRPYMGGGEPFPGTLSLRMTTQLRLLEDVLDGVLRSGFRDVLVYNWHFENSGVLWEACDAVARHYPDAKFVVLASPLPDGPEDPQLMQALFDGDFKSWNAEHASVVETSIMLLLDSSRVRTDRIVDGGTDDPGFYEVLPPKAGAVHPTGVGWHPKGSDAQKGALLVDAAVQWLAEVLRSEFPEAGVLDSPPTPRNRTRRLVEVLSRAFADADSELGLTPYASECELRQVRQDREQVTARNHDELRSLYERLFAAFVAPRSARALSVTADERSSLVEWEFAGADGAVLRSAAIYEWDGPLVARERMYLDESTPVAAEHA